MINDEQYYRGGFAKSGISREHLADIQSRSLGPDGKVYRGEAGKQLQRRKQEIQDYARRNGS